MKMAKVEIPHVQSFKDRHGKARYYYRRKGFARVKLPGLPGSAEFMKAYAVAGRSIDMVDARQHPSVKPRSINALFIEYYRSEAFLSLAPATQQNYRRILDRFRAKYGDRSAVQIGPTHLNAIFHEMASTPGAVRTLRKRLSTAFAVAVDLGWRKDNPVRETKQRKRHSQGFIPWSEEDIAAFERRWPSGTKERLALALLLHTGMRRSDVVTLGWQHVAEGRISVVQAKTDARVRIPVHRKLQAEIDQVGGLTFLMTQYGRPFTRAGFTKWFVERARMAGLQDRTPHGLRKACGRRLAEAGCSAKQIAAVLGHQTLHEVETYTRDADQGRLADDAFVRLEGKG